MMQNHKRDILRKHREDISQSIHDIKSVVSKLSDNKIITQYMEEEILAKSTRIEKGRHLLSILPRRGEIAFEGFFKVLLECDEHVAAQYLEGKGGITEHQIPSVFPDPADDSKIVNVQKCIPINGEPMYEKYKRCLNNQQNEACQGTLYDYGSRNTHMISEKENQEMDEITQKLDELNLHPAPVDQVDAKVSNPARRADMLVAMATSPGFVSWRNIEIGTWFIQAIVYPFKYWACDQELTTLMTRVNFLVHSAETSVTRNKQSPECRSSLGKSLYFFPGLVHQEPEQNISHQRNQQQPMDQSQKSQAVLNPTNIYI